VLGKVSEAVVHRDEHGAFGKRDPPVEAVDILGDRERWAAAGGDRIQVSGEGRPG
jgi:hypothetical protein